MALRLVFIFLLSTLAAIAPLHAAQLASSTRLVSSSTEYGTVAPVFRALHVSTAGTYTVTLSDLTTSGAPMFLLVTRGNTEVARLDHAGSTTFSATAGNYTVQVIGDGDHAAAFGVDVANGASLLSFVDSLNARQIPTPDTDLLDVTFEVPANGNYTVGLQDFAFPVGLNAVTFTVQKVGEAALLGSSHSAGSFNFDTTAGTHRLLVYATVSSTTHAGSYGVTVSNSNTSATLYETSRSIDTSSSPTAQLAYNYPLHIANAGNYSVEIKDLHFPEGHSLTWNASVFEDTTTLASGGASPATLNFTTASAIDVFIPVIVAPPADGNGLFWIRVKDASGTVLFEKTQAVGAAVQTFDVAVPAAGFYNVTLNDLVFPATLSPLEMAISAGDRADPVIQRFTDAGTKSLDTLVAATYAVSIYAVPNAAAHYGVFGYSVDGPVSRPAPVINSFTASQLEVASGATIRVSWSASDADICTHDWSSSTALVDSVMVGPLTTDKTLVLTCTGDGGTTSQSLSIHVTTAAASTEKGGGGGALSWGLLVLLVGIGGVRRAHRVH